MKPLQTLPCVCVLHVFVISTCQLNYHQTSTFMSHVQLFLLIRQHVTTSSSSSIRFVIKEFNRFSYEIETNRSCNPIVLDIIILLCNFTWNYRSFLSAPSFINQFLSGRNNHVLSSRKVRFENGNRSYEKSEKVTDLSVSCNYTSNIYSVPYLLLSWILV